MKQVSLLLVAWMLLIGGTAHAQQLAGRFVFAPGDRVVASLAIHGEGDNRRIVHERPEGLMLTARTLEETQGDIVRFEGGPGSIEDDRLRVKLVAPDGDSRTVVIEGLGEDVVALTYEGTAVAPVLLRRSQAAIEEQGLAGALPLDLDANWPDNPQMTAMFEADQGDRRNMGDGADAWSAVATRDKERRAHTRALLERGTLRSGRDFYHAAFVFQHGGEPEDYLLAHTLATAAMARGYPRAAWIAAATLDRYLGAIGRPQIFGTQYSGIRSEDGQMNWSMGDYDDDLLTDGLRLIHSVPPRAAQQERLRRYAEDTPSQ